MLKGAHQRCIQVYIDLRSKVMPLCLMYIQRV